MNPINEIVAEYAALKAQADRDQKRLKELRAQILNVLPDGGSAGEYQVNVSRPKTMDWAKVEAAFPASAYPQIWTALDRDAVKDHVAPAILDTFTTEGSPRMTVK
ncbi:hypothetical protein [Flaviflexus massiliensis]|uniref:hypothetical protein n=1 Tax=Flaviflexus massiliensis TaxID=1522309 RepID=UPI0006D54815|nr:hypothetical protein [Flaviflexus massiliensis]